MGGDPMATVLRPLSTGELLDRTFSLYRGNFVLFLGIFALPHLAVLAFQIVAIVLQSPGLQPSRVFSALAWTWGAILFSIVVTSAAHAATVIAVSHVYLDRPASILDSFAKVKGQIGGVIWLSISVGFLVGLACIALIVPGVLLAVRWSLAVPAKVLENKTTGEAMSRSSELSKGNRGRIFVIWILFVVLNICFSLLLQWPVKLAAGVGGIVGLQHATIAWRVASLVATFASECLVGPLATIAFSLVYYDERVRKEAFDMQLMMSTLDAPALQTSPAPA
jgi:hypothetical protein